MSKKRQRKTINLKLTPQWVISDHENASKVTSTIKLPQNDHKMTSIWSLTDLFRLKLTIFQVRVPYKVVGLVVGPKGTTIKRIQQTTHTYIVTPSREKDPVFEVTGWF